jgi:phosphatidate phosphatase PAH1
MAKSSVRIPVVIYNGLSRRDESRIFIDINTRQKPVPNELLLDIKSLAQYESEIEQELRDIFDLFHTDSNSCILGLTSPAKKSRNKISRVTFNSAFKPIARNFGDKESQEIFEICNAYLSSFINGLKIQNISSHITNPTVFRAVITIFPHVAQRTKDKYNNYRQDSFSEVLSPLFSKLKISKISKPGNSYRDLANYLIECLKTDFVL